MNEEVIEEAAKAIAESMSGWNEGTSEPGIEDEATRKHMESHWASVNEACLKVGREHAQIALTVLEKAHATTDDEGVGDLKGAIRRLSKYMNAGSLIHDASSYRTGDGTVHIIEFEDLRAVLYAARRTVQGEPKHDGNCEAGDPEYMTSACRCDERSLGEPTDAMVAAALERYWGTPGPWPHRSSQASSMRAALRAALAATNQPSAHD